MPATSHASTSKNFDAALERAKLQALYNFAYGLSHEINNPLANITMRAQALIEGERNPVRRKSLAAIMQQAFRAHEMIADLMFFARPPALVLEEVDLAKLAKAVVEELRQQAREQGTKLVLAKASGPLIASADPTQLAAALKALVQNALEAVANGGRVEVKVESSADFRCQMSDFRLDDQHKAPPAPNLKSEIPNLKLSVTDTGPGIPPEIRPHIFDPYYSGREAGRGLGLGLSKAWRIAELHGGTIEVESPPAGGARLVLLVPSSGA